MPWGRSYKLVESTSAHWKRRALSNVHTSTRLSTVSWCHYHSSRSSWIPHRISAFCHGLRVGMCWRGQVCWMLILWWRLIILFPAALSTLESAFSQPVNVIIQKTRWRVYRQGGWGITTSTTLIQDRADVLPSCRRFTSSFCLLGTGSGQADKTTLIKLPTLIPFLTCRSGIKPQDSFVSSSSLDQFDTSRVFPSCLRKKRRIWEQPPWSFFLIVLKERPEISSSRMECCQARGYWKAKAMRRITWWSSGHRFVISMALTIFSYISSREILAIISRVKIFSIPQTVYHPSLFQCNLLVHSERRLPDYDPGFCILLPGNVRINRFWQGYSRTAAHSCWSVISTLCSPRCVA